MSSIHVRISSSEAPAQAVTPMIRQSANNIENIFLIIALLFLFLLQFLVVFVRYFFEPLGTRFLAFNLDSEM